MVGGGLFLHRLGVCADWLALDLEVALNYGQATGSPQLLRFVTEHTEVG